MNPNKKIRRLQSLLYTSGVGTILFSLWWGIRGTGIVYALLKEMPISGDGGISAETMTRIAGILIFLIVSCLIGVYLYIGRKAMLTSLGKKTGNLYIVLAILFLADSIKAYISNMINLPPSQWINTGGIMLSMIDLTSNVILAEVVVFSILLKWQR